MPLHVSNICAHHQEVKIALHSLWLNTDINEDVCLAGRVNIKVFTTDWGNWPLYTRYKVSCSVNVAESLAQLSE